MADKQVDLRIVSLIPSATEIVAALGYGDYLVGRSHECDYPASVRDLPVCTEPKFDPVGTSAQIHSRVSELLTSALSVYRVNTELLAKLRPTHIITQAQCEVCAVSLSDVEGAVTELMETTFKGLAGPPVKIVSLQPERLADVWTDMERVAEAFKRHIASPVSETEIIDSLKARLPKENFSEQPRPKVVCVEWTDPLMAAGNWVPELVHFAGGQDCLGKAGDHSDWMSWEDLRAADPDIVVVMPCGYGMAKTREATAEMANNPTWKGLKAVQNNQVYIVDGNQYFNRPGPRLVESYEILAEIIQGKEIDLARHIVGWERF
ncbi:MAG: cobalamin-binding protein [Cyanobacteria bacterium J06581_3]